MKVVNADGTAVVNILDVEPGTLYDFRGVHFIRCVTMESVVSDGGEFTNVVGICIENGHYHVAGDGVAETSVTTIPNAKVVIE